MKNSLPETKSLVEAAILNLKQSTDDCALEQKRRAVSYLQIVNDELSTIIEITERKERRLLLV